MLYVHSSNAQRLRYTQESGPVQELLVATTLSSRSKIIVEKGVHLCTLLYDCNCCYRLVHSFTCAGMLPSNGMCREMVYSPK